MLFVGVRKYVYTCQLLLSCKGMYRTDNLQNIVNVNGIGIPLQKCG